MPKLSPAAWSILAAATQRIYNLDPEDVPLSASEHGSVIAAALRAAVDQIFPDERDTSTELIRSDLLAIAAELDPQ